MSKPTEASKFHIPNRMATAIKEKEEKAAKGCPNRYLTIKDICERRQDAQEDTEMQELQFD